MKRDLVRLSANPYDLLVIGGGVYGLFTAWDAALRGLSVALVDQGDFGHATSFNSLKLIHRGLRYLRNGDVRRVRLSIREATAWLRIAPHLVHPVPFLVPTYGHGSRGREVFALAVLLHEALGFRLHRRHGSPKGPGGRIVSRSECVRLIPGVEPRGLSGGAIFYEYQVSSTERLIVSLARSAGEAGCEMANHVAVIGFLRGGDRVVGVKTRDVLTGSEFDILARVTVNCTGPWGERVRSLMGGRIESRYCKAFNLLVGRPLVGQYAIGIYSKDEVDKRPVSAAGPRLLFVTPWSGYSLIGTAHLSCDHDPDNSRVTEVEIDAFLEQINAAHPPFDLNRQDVSFVYGGLVPLRGGKVATKKIELAERYQILDHWKEEKTDGFISVAGVKFTEARHVAEKTVDLAFKKLDRTPVACTTSMTPLHGGRIERLDDYFAQETSKAPAGLDEEMVRRLISHYGAAYPGVLQYLESREGVPARSVAARVMEAEVLHGIHEEMAQRLSDVVLRRLAGGIVREPGETALHSCAAIMAKELNWSQDRTHEEVRQTRADLYPGDIGR